MATSLVEFRRKREYELAESALERVTIRSPDDIMHAAVEMQREVRARNLHIMMWHNIGTLEPIRDPDGKSINRRIFGWNEDELSKITDTSHLSRSPLLRACRVESEPFWVNRQAVRTRWKNRTLDELQLEDFERRSGTKAAIVLPIHLPLAQIGMAILTSEDPNKTDLSEEFMQSAEWLLALARRFVDGYVRVSQVRNSLAIDASLTKRQIECLYWAARGKTDWEIGEILGCSHAGVRYHMVKASEALDTTNRAQTIYHACLLGYLTFTDRRSETGRHLLSARNISVAS